MTINLDNYVGNTVVVDFRDGSTWTASLQRHDSTHYPFFLSKSNSDFYHTYTEDGHIWSNKEPHDYDIVRIRIFDSHSRVYNPNLDELQRQEADLKRKLQETQAKLEEVQAQIKQAERDRLPLNFNREFALRFLANPTDTHSLDWAFSWSSTPQGHGYWLNISDHPSRLSQDDIIQIQTWIIQSFYGTKTN